MGLYFSCLTRLISLTSSALPLVFVTKACAPLLCLLALLPMSLYIGCGISADVVTNGVALLLIAYIIFIKYTSAFELRQYITLGVLALILSQLKLVYTPLVLLAFGLKGQHTAKFGKYLIPLIVILSFTGAYVWTAITHNLQLTYKEYNPEFSKQATIVAEADIYAQTHIVLHDPLRFLKFVFNSLSRHAKELAISYTGSFGWQTFSIPFWLTSSLLGGTAFVAICSGCERTKVDFSFRVLIFSVFLLITILVYLSQYLTWAPVGAYYLLIQGRYLIPIAPLLFIMLPIKPSKQFAIALVTICLSVFALTYSAIQIKQWFIG